MAWTLSVYGFQFNQIPITMELVVFIVPAFFLFLGLEFWAAKRKGKAHVFSYENSISNISVGIAERILNLLIAASFYKLYQFIYENYAIANIPNNPFVWVVLLLATDFVWYWYHRLGHEINVMWGAHIVHHQSEDFNYTVSARITVIQALVRNVFWCILPFVGFHHNMVITILVVHGTYSFFTHTQMIGKLGWLEYIFITPSHHGVHHASNEKYLNKNYGDIFVFWDLMFGTFQREEEKPVYGLTHPLKSHSFLWQHFHYYAELYEACRRSGSFWKSLRIIFGKPEELDQDIRPQLESKLLVKSTIHTTGTRLRRYINFQIIAGLFGVALFSYYYPTLNAIAKVSYISIILLTLINCGALLEQKRWIYYLEVVRAFVILIVLSYWLESPTFLFGGILLLLPAGFLDSIRQLYFDLVYGTEHDQPAPQT